MGGDHLRCQCLRLQFMRCCYRSRQPPQNQKFSSLTLLPSWIVFPHLHDGLIPLVLVNLTIRIKKSLVTYYLFRWELADVGHSSRRDAERLRFGADRNLSYDLDGASAPWRDSDSKTFSVLLSSAVFGFH